MQYYSTSGAVYSANVKQPIRWPKLAQGLCRVGNSYAAAAAVVPRSPYLRRRKVGACAVRLVFQIVQFNFSVLTDATSNA